ncbi:hypothetical protein [Nitrosospira sp. Nsp1]|uniref:hypothetical protein n=1 Tax=Nitrosospira sp. Nsp1 TaxID=136547 RepID=UPI0008872B67|nr:hypothetical protein [Nitrosospira sp. Nsp1]SCX62740.1 hypothetical protein SAMN05720354_13228 [Nitrosospira sp. Nsp1]
MAEIRVNVDDEFLEDLKKKLGNPKNTEIIQDALALLNWGADAKKAGRDVLSADKDRKDLEKLVLPRLSQIKKD